MLTTIDGTPARPLGLAAGPSQPRSCVRMAYDAGVNVFFFFGPSGLKAFADLPTLVRRSRERVIVATGSGSRSARGLERVRRAACRPLGTDVIDLFVAEYVSPGDDPAVVFGKGGVLDVLRDWRDAGAIRYVGASTHDADLGLRFVRDGRVDVLMLRFNMAHRRVGGAVFPSAHRAQVPIMAYTATRWGTLLHGHPEWDGPVPTATECYGYCLAQPVVEVVLTAPASLAQARANVEVLRRRVPGARACAQWEAYGDLVHGDGASEFETLWP